MKKNVKRTQKSVNVALVGYGYWGPNIVRNFFEVKDEDVHLVTCCDTRKERLELVKEKYPTIKTTTNIDDILSNPTIDAIIIATPTNTHFSIAKKALEAGKHVWIEKPMTQNVEQAKILLKIAKKNKRIIHVDHIFIYTEAVSIIKQMLNKGDLGEIYYFDSVRINLGLFQHDINVIWDLAPHDIYIMLYLLNESPQAVSVLANSHVVKGLEDTAYLNFQFASGKNAHIHVSWLSPVKIRRSIIAGSKKMILYDDLESSDKVKVYDSGISYSNNAKNKSTDLGYYYRTGNIFTPATHNIEALHTQSKEFVNAIRTNQPTRTTGEEGLQVIKILEAASSSIKNNGALTKIDS